MKAHARDYARVAINQTQTEKELPYDTVHGFDGTKIYDYNGYLVKLLIASHQINPVFQMIVKLYLILKFLVLIVYTVVHHQKLLIGVK